MNSGNKKITNQMIKTWRPIIVSIILFALPLFILGFLLIYFEHTSYFFLFPKNHEVSCYTYADSSLGGNSRILEYKKDESQIIFRYQFGNSIESPFTGLTFMIDKERPIKLKNFSQIHLNMESDFSRISLYIKYFIPGYSVKDAYLSYNTKEVIFNSTEDKKNYTINLDDFSTPSWWYEMNGLSRDIEPEDKNIPLDYEISIGFTGLADDANSYTLKINEISLKKDYSIIWFLVILVVAAWYGILIFIFRKKQIPNFDSQALESVILYLSDNFNKPGLTLKITAKELNLSPTTIDYLLHSQFKRNFTSYITDLKLEKAKEILVNTNNHISEIAYFLGFKYPSYFNRIFHRAFGVSPGEYRKRKKASS